MKHKDKKEKESRLSEETIQSVLELGSVLQKIHNRLLVEGKIKVENGKVIFNE